MELFSPNENPLQLPALPVETVPTEPTHDTTYGTCLPPPETDPSLAPCLRINGRLVPNPSAKYCRYFKSQLQNPNDTTCPTICPDSCTELWESCPSGTGQLASVVHSKDVSGVISQMIGNSSAPTTNHKDYRECYAFGTKFCTYPETKLTRQSDGTYVCQKDCPANTYADGDMCLVNDPLQSPAGLTQSLFCNPQYFTTVITNGIFQGCKKIPLGTKDTNSCPVNTETILNDSFTSEWCLPKCSENFYPSPNLDFCFAKCDTGTPFHDYVSYFVKTGRCSGSPCPGDMAGRCPVPSALASNANTYSGYTTKSVPSNMKAYVFKDSSLHDTYRSGLSVTKPGTGTIECPNGMAAGEPNTGEDSGHCYDMCPEGFARAELCSSTGLVSTSGIPNCEAKDLRFVCLATCPKNYTEKLLDARQQKVYSCAYNYPNGKEPSDPSLFVQCPTNGTMISVVMDNTTLPNGNSVKPVPPVCLRKMFMRNVACPINHVEINSNCIQNCPNGSLPISKNGTITCTATCPSDSRFQQDYASLYSTALLGSFQDSHCIRKSFGTGAGKDPLLLSAGTPVGDARTIGIGLAGVLGVAFVLMLVRKFI